jgi:Stage II sporulation protein
MTVVAGSTLATPVQAGRSIAASLVSVGESSAVLRAAPAEGASVGPVPVAFKVASLGASPVPVGPPPPTTGASSTPETTPSGNSSSSTPATTIPGSVSATAAPTTLRPSKQVVLSGHGYGHGRGLGQWGAYGYAVDKGWDYRRILGHFYSNTSIGKLSLSSALGVRLTAQDAKPLTVYQQSGRINLSINGQIVAPRPEDVVGDVGTTGANPSPSVPPVTQPATGPIAVGTPAATIPAGNSGNAGSAGTTLGSTDPSGVPVPSTTPPLIEWSMLPAGQPMAIRMQLIGSGRFTISEGPGCNGPWKVRGTVSASAVTASLGTPPADRNDPAPMLQVCTSSSRRAYRGDLATVDAKPGQYTVNQVNMEDYLRGVLPAEVPSGWGSKPNGMEALKAQAVAARSYSAAEKRSAFSNTCDTVACQVYSGRGEYKNGGFVSYEDSRADEAIRATAGEIRADAKGNPIRTEFSSSTGGQSAPGDFPPVKDEGDATTANPHSNWTVVLTGARLESGRKLGAFLDLEVVLRDGVGPYGGRVQNLNLVFEKGKVPLKSGEFLRAHNLRSVLFDVKVVDLNGGGSSGSSGAAVGSSVPVETIPFDGTSGGGVGVAGTPILDAPTPIDSTPAVTIPVSAAKLSGKPKATTTKKVPVTKKVSNVSVKGTVIVAPVGVGKKGQTALDTPAPVTTVKKKKS